MTTANATKENDEDFLARMRSLRDANKEEKFTYYFEIKDLDRLITMGEYLVLGYRKVED